MRINNIRRLVAALVVALLAPAASFAADPTLSIESFTIKAGETKEMLIDLTNPGTEITLVQFDLRLPSGLSIAEEEDEMLIDIAGRTTYKKHSLDANAIDGITRFLLSSTKNSVISGESGAIISIMLTASASFNGGDIMLEGQRLVMPDAVATTYKPATYTYHIEGTQSDAVTIKAKSYSRVYGEANPTFGYEVTEGTITSGTPTVTCSATKTSPVGTYDIVINEGSVSNGTVNLVNGTLTITKAPLTISAGNYTKLEGEANPTFSPTFSGFRNNETKSVLTTQPTITTTATTSSPAGTYPVTVSGAAAQNYDISYVNGTLTVTAKPDNVTIKAKSYSRVYGEANPTFGYEVTEGTITSGTPTVTCSATKTSPVGTYDIIISKGSVSNGTVNLVKGTLTITKAPLTISAGNYTKQEGEANPTFTPTFSGFKNSETKAVLTTQPTITTTATTSSPAGTYPVTVSGAAAQNYDISYVNGTLTVTAKPVDNANTFEPDYFWPDMSENVDKIEFIVIGFPKELGHFSADKLKLLDNEGTQVRTLQARWLDDDEYVEGAPFYKADKDIYQFVKFVFSSENTAAVKATGIYQFTVPEGYVWNDKYNDSDDDKGISAGARYNPEFTITYHVIEDVPVVKENIEFADAKVKGICIANWDRNNDGELSKEEAAMVTSLANKFNYNKEITSFDELQYFTGLSSIGRDFYGCKNLRSVTLPTSLTSISTAAFSSCESLRKIHIPEKVNSIGFNPFSSCTNLEEMTVATNNPYFDSRNGCNAIIKKDNNELISGCKTSVIPEGLVNINYGAFLYISTLTSINIPASVKCISYADGWHGDDGTNPFIYCSGLTSITVADGNPVYDSRDNCNAVIETSTNTLRVGCKATMIPNSVKIIGSMAFEGSGVTRVDIPDSIEEVKSAAFMDCKSLTEVTLSSSINTIGQHSFGECTNLQKVTSNIFDPFELDYLTFYPKVPVLYVPKGRKAAYEAAGWAQYFSKIIEMDEDGIDEMDNGQWTMDNVVIYNLSGQRLSKPQRGVNIINGKKIVVK